MSYNQNYGQANSQGYGQYNPYGQQNPYDQRGDDQGGYNTSSQGYSQGNPYAQQDNYGQQRPNYHQQSSSRYDEERAQGSYEMGHMGGQSGDDPNRVLNEVRTIDRELDQLEGNVNSLQALRIRQLGETNTTKEQNEQIKIQIKQHHDAVMMSYSALTARVRTLKQNPHSGNPRNAPQVGKVDRRLKKAFSESLKKDAEYRKEWNTMLERQYKIVRPDASEQEVREMLESPQDAQIFSQGLLNIDRRGEAQRVLKRAQDRHEAIKQIEEDFITIQRLLNELEAQVIQQEDQVANIEVKADTAQEHVAQATVELDGAVIKAKAARKKKWICFGIVVLIIIIVIAVAVGVVEANKSRNSA